MNLDQARTNMVEQQIRTWEVLDQDVLDLLYVVPREEFVTAAYRNLAFSDLEVPLPNENPGGGERMWCPKLEARVLQELAPRRSERVLEIGTGSGYLTALLAHRAAEVVSLEINPALAAFGRENLARHGADNVKLLVADGSRGYAQGAPWDVIVLTGSVPVLPRALLESLAPGGRLFAAVGEAPAMSAQLITCIAPGAQRNVTLFETVLAPLANCERPSRFEFWMKNLLPRELSAWLADAGRGKPQLVDVREPWEHEKCSIEPSRLVPLRELPARAGELDPQADTVLICHHGGRSLQAAMFLERQGFARVYNLTGGVAAWAASVDPAMPQY